MELKKRCAELEIKYLHERYTDAEIREITNNKLANWLEPSGKWDAYSTYLQECQARAYAEVYGK